MERQFRVLIAEDEPIAALDLSMGLKRHGYSVCGIVSTGVGAVKSAFETEPDCILMDLRLADSVDGIAASGSIRESTDVPIVFTTASTDHETLERIALVKNSRLVRKPYSIDRVVASLKAFLEP